MHLRASLLATVLASALSMGCVKAPTPPRQVTLSSAVVAQEVQGVVAIAATLDGDPSHVTLCSGALVAPNLVLTARHCVTHAVTATPACDAHGVSHNGAHLSEDADPSSISIYLGDRVHVDRDLPRARALRTLHPQGTTLCDSDVAFLVLDRNIDEATILPMRLHGGIESGDRVMPVGFGGGTANVIGDRAPRGHSTVLAVGPSSNGETGAVLGPREFEVDVATCRGDSGGPAIDMNTGEVVGVISRGASCTALGNHVYTRVDAYAGLANVALREATRATQESVALHEATPRHPPSALR